ncbi:MAG: acetoin utilization protein AcuC [Gammaproteobacteria bacterium]|nr:acetoin utilization protein AcuC [Gammaproteobacteria bacterium]|tara:strand:- start:6182 stop:7153 length:972 start_codon:yes stop_codon:yes gene_type:complete
MRGIGLADSKILVVKDDNIAAYGFGDDHPFGPDRHGAFHRYLSDSGISSLVHLATSEYIAVRADIERFHTNEYIDRVIAHCQLGKGFLDDGDTPAIQGLYESSLAVVGASLFVTAEIISGRFKRAFVPIAGLHHARRNSAGGFCVFNDIGVVIETLRKIHGVNRIAYIDIDAHHGDGVYYSYEEDPNLIFVDVHEDGRFLFPGTGFPEEIGIGLAIGTKKNISLKPGDGDVVFQENWSCIHTFLDDFEPEFFILQCGADSLLGDPITNLALSERSHYLAAQSLTVLAEKHAKGRIIALGGGGYNRDNIGRAWTQVVKAFVDHP